MPAHIFSCVLMRERAWMAFKFNRGCWVESGERALLGLSIGPDLRGPLFQEEKILLACSLFSALRARLRGIPRIRELLSRLDRSVSITMGAMIDLGIVSACAACDENSPFGSCCSSGLEQKFDVYLLLANLLLGSTLPTARSRKDSCYFLGPAGCLLRVRHMLCVDYLCPEIERALGPEKLAKIQAIAGEEIQDTFILWEALKEEVGSLAPVMKWPHPKGDE